MKGKKSSSNSGIVLLGCILIFQFLPVSAQVDIPDSIITERIKTIQMILNQGQPGANQWWYVWLAGYSAGMVAQGTVYFISDDLSTRQDMALGAATAFLGAAGQLLTPRVPGYAADRLILIPDSSPGERQIKLSRAEELLKASAMTQKAGRSWKVHVIFGAVNLSSGLITWLAFKRTVWAGVGNFALNTVITETQIWTQPTRILKDYQNYCRKYSSGAEVLDNKPGLNWFVGVYPGGIGIKLVF